MSNKSMTCIILKLPWLWKFCCISNSHHIGTDTLISINPVPPSNQKQKETYISYTKTAFYTCYAAKVHASSEERQGGKSVGHQTWSRQQPRCFWHAYTETVQTMQCLYSYLRAIKLLKQKYNHYCMHACMHAWVITTHHTTKKNEIHVI